MISTGPTANALPVRSGADLQTAGQAQPVAAATSGTKGDAQSAVAAETTKAVDPAQQSADAQALPQNQSNDEARFVEPSRASAESLTRQAEAPDAKTPAGPPPTFDWSVLEKARALAATGTPQEAPKPAPDAAPSPEADAATAQPQPSQTPQTAEATPEAAPEPAPQTAEATPPAPEPAQTAEADSAPAATATRPAVEGTVPPGVELQ